MTDWDTYNETCPRCLHEWTVTRHVLDREAAVRLLERWVQSFAAGSPAGIVMAHDVDLETRRFLADEPVSA